MGPRIGIPLCLDDRGRWKHGREYHYIDTRYARAVEANGGVALYLPMSHEPAALADHIDGLLLPGGDDFAPPRAYPPEVRFDPVPGRQLAFDRDLLAAALTRRLPVLGICYGMQLLALQHGGALHYHLPLDRPDSAPHQLPEDGGRHWVRVEPETRLAGVLGAREAVNSLHHQGVAETGRGLRVCARSEDGLIEAIEAPEPPFCLGVQWHPEKLSGEHRDRLFGAFVAACAQAAGAGDGAAEA